MNVVIMGCGRVGAAVATRLSLERHEVTVIDLDSYAFRRYLTGEFRGRTLVGSGTDEGALEEAGIRQADAFIALTGGDNRNILASQMAKHVYGVGRVVARVKDPFRAEIFADLGIHTFSPTKVGADLAYAELFSEDEAGAPRG